MNVLQETFRADDFNDTYSTSMMDNIYSEFKPKQQIVRNNAKIKSDLIRSTMDQIFIQLNKSNLTKYQLENIMTNINNILYYLLSSNIQSQHEMYLLHVCYVFILYFDIL